MTLRQEFVAAIQGSDKTTNVGEVREKPLYVQTPEGIAITVLDWLDTNTDRLAEAVFSLPQYAALMGGTERGRDMLSRSVVADLRAVVAVLREDVG